MISILFVAAIPILMAAGPDGPGPALIAVASVMWAGGVALCTEAPVLTGRSGTALNERLAIILSMAASLGATAGVVLTISELV